MRGFSLTLQWLLTSMLLLVIILSMGSLSVLSFRSGRAAVLDLASQLRQELVSRIGQQIQTYVKAPFLINAVNTIAVSYQDIDPSQEKGFYLFWQQSITSPGTDLIYCGNEVDGSFMAVGKSGGDLVHLITSRPDSDRRNFKLNDFGEKISAIPYEILQKKYDPRQRPWYKKAVAKKDSVWSEIYLDFDSALPVITASTPIYRTTDRQLIGVCAVDFLLSRELNTFLSTIKVSDTGETFIVERSGTLVASSTSESESTFISEGQNSGLRLAAESQIPRLKETMIFLQKKYGSLQSIQQPQEEEFALEREGEQYVQVVPFRDGKGIDWLTIVVVPERDFMARIYRNIQINSMAGLAILVLVSMAGIAITQSITRPIRSLVKASQQIAEGQLDKRVKVKGIKEIEILASSFNQMAAQLKTLVNTLEDRVYQRTQELQHANAEISILNDRLRQENLRLGAEIDVVRRLHQLVLPKSAELSQVSELDIDGYMCPASAVGGDYYDVLRADDRLIIAIGDVVGHGLESGMIMLMTQMAIRTLLLSSKTNLYQFMNVLNGALFANVNRMESDRTMTLALLEYTKGQIQLIGQHEELIIIHEEGTIERWDTIDLGFPLALESDISPYLQVLTVPFCAGDVAILYTDGITEAENMDNELYGHDRFYKVLIEHCQRSSQEIRQAVIADIVRHQQGREVLDDITLVILKHP